MREHEVPQSFFKEITDRVRLDLSNNRKAIDKVFVEIDHSQLSDQQITYALKSLGVSAAEYFAFQAKNNVTQADASRWFNVRKWRRAQQKVASGETVIASKKKILGQ